MEVAITAAVLALLLPIAGLDDVDSANRHIRSPAALTALDDLTITSWHEAAHAAAHRHFHWRFNRVRIYEDADDSIKGEVTYPARQGDAFARAICSLAGPICEARLTGVPIEQQSGSRTDLAMAKEALAQAGPEFSIASIMPFTNLLVDHEWAAIERIVEALMIRHELSYDDVVELIFNE